MSRKEELEEFYRKSMEAVDNEHYCNTDRLSEVGELCNEYNVTSSELRNLIDTKHPFPNNFHEALYDETLGMELEEKIDKLQYIRDKFNTLNCDLHPKTVKKIFNIIRDAEGHRTF